MWFHNRVPLGYDLPGIILLLYDVLYTCHVFIQSVPTAAAALCVAMLVLLQQLLLFVIVCRMVSIVAG